MKTWFTSDHHFGHANIIKYCNRPFDGTHDMNVAMEAAWNEVVEPNDLVYYLGDFAMNANLVSLLVSKLNGIKILIPGNHDKCWQKTEPGNRWFAHYIDAGFQSIEQQMTLEIAEQQVLLNHLPYRNLKEPEQKYFAQRPVDKNGWLIHGHVHQRWKVNNKQVNVSVDAWNFKPVSLDEIVEIINSGPELATDNEQLETADGY